MVGRLVVQKQLQQNSSIKDQVVNMLGFAGQKKTLRVLCRYIYNKRENYLHRLFMDKIQNKIKIEYFFFCDTGLLMRRMEFFGGGRGNIILN